MRRGVSVAAAAPCLSVLPCLVAAAADKVVNGSLFALPVDRGVNNNYFNNSRLLPFTECLMRQLNRSQTFQNVHSMYMLVAKLKDCCQYVVCTYL